MAYQGRKVAYQDRWQHNDTGEFVTVDHVGFHHVRVVGPTIKKTFGFSDFMKKFTFVRSAE